MTTSVEDRIQAELWRGAIPVEIHLAADEVADVRAPPPFFGLIPRGAYLPVWHDRETEPSPRRHFEQFVVARFPDDKGTKAIAIADAVGDEDARPETASARSSNDPTTRASKKSAPPREARDDRNENENENENVLTKTPCWFDHDGTPLRWDVCAGILHDVFVRRDSDGAVASAEPWRLTVHYAAYREIYENDPRAREAADGSRNRRDPGSFACVEAQSCARAHFFNALKEATHIERGSAASVMSMTRAAQTNLWRSVLTGDRRLAFEAEEALSVGSSNTISNVSRDGPRDTLADDVRRLIPVRVYVCQMSDTREAPGRERRRRDVVWTSAPVPVFRAAENGARVRKATARDALALVAAPPDGSDAATDDAYDEVWRCSVQGVDVRLDTPLDALHARMRGADRFLHVCAVRRRAP